MTHTIRRELTLSQDPQTVWRALTTAEALAEWMYPNDFEPRVGHRFTFRVPPKPQLESGLVVECHKASQSQQLAGQFPAVPRSGWRALGIVEMLGAALVIVPAATSWMPALTAIAAAALAAETLAITVVYARASSKLTAENPLVWSAVMFALVAFVAYGRYAIEPLS